MTAGPFRGRPSYLAGMSRTLRWTLAGLALLALAGSILLGVNCSGLKRAIVSVYPRDYSVKGDPSNLTPSFEGKDEARERIAISLTVVGAGFENPTDVQFAPTDALVAVVTEQGGKAKALDLRDGKTSVLLEIEVLTASEEGLLGLAFHPRFNENGKLYLNYVVDKNGEDTSRVGEWRVPPGSDLRAVKLGGERAVMEVQQPYPNHNAGQLVFGPDGMLYVGWGDGGWRDDPHGNGQNPMTMLGSMLRIDVDRSEGGKAYAVPADNPFVGRAGFLPETWAFGLRNPWRYSFDPRGRLIVADVGQDTFEEIDIVERGKNYGWDPREGRHCFEPKEGCRTEGLSDPIYEYGRDEGQSVTGGFVYTGARLPALAGKYVFADFVTGRLWALDLPENDPDGRGPLAKAYTLGKWPMVPSTFGRDAQGELYVADYASGRVFRLDPAVAR
jgi:glucose/arabinose dehydrogenase